MQASVLIIGLGLGLVLLAIALARHLLHKTSFSMGLTVFLSLAAVLCLGYVVVLFFMVGSFRYNVSEADQAEPLVVSNETPLIPLTEADKDPNRPAWVDAEPHLVGDRYEISVASDPKLTTSEAQADLALKTKAATRKYIDDLIRDGADQVQASSDFIARQIQQETYLEPVTLTVGEMVIAHALLVFDNEVRDEFRQQHKAAEVKNRMEQAGGIAGLVLALVGASFGFLKLDTLTRGYYSGRLQVAAAALILGVAWAGYMLVGTSR